MNRPYSSWIVTMSRDSGAGAYSQSAPDRSSWPISQAATGDAGLPPMCPWPPDSSATLTYPGGAKKRAVSRRGGHDDPVDARCEGRRVAELDGVVPGGELQRHGHRAD